LHDNRRIGPNPNASNVHRHCTTTLYLRHKLSTPKFIIESAANLGIHYSCWPGSSVA
jgi:hypothetical protein